MKPSDRRALDTVCDHLVRRRSAILTAWRKASESDPDQQTARALTRNQFNDHIPEVLDGFEAKLRASPGDKGTAKSNREQKDDQVKHGLHRWQQGYRLQELMKEWGLLQLCVFEELEAFAATQADFPAAVLAEVNRQMIGLVNGAISESAAQYEHLQQAEAASHVGGLQVALDRVETIERGRSMLIHQAVHDISNNVYGVRMAANLLGGSDDNPTERAEFAALLEDGVQGVTSMLGELLELARLEAGQETRVVALFDASTLVRSLALAKQPVAQSRGLRLSTHGPTRLSVEGDAGKVRRVLQNLVGNALKYTSRGGVDVSWGAEKESWWLKVSDTGPGLPSGGSSAPLAANLLAATASARESDETNSPSDGKASQVLEPASGAPATEQATSTQPGEGIGLSIVRRLCELLDASLETASSPTDGTTFRVVMPRRYTAASKRAKPRKKKAKSLR